MIFTRDTAERVAWIIYSKTNTTWHNAEKLAWDILDKLVDEGERK